MDLASFPRRGRGLPEGEGDIEIINNTRGGIVNLIQSKKGNAPIGGQTIKMLK
jgi:hypothetical protein